MDEVENCSVDLDCVKLDHFVYVENVELACATPVKGRLREHLAFWKDIGASKWVLDVLRDGYSLPFMSLLQKAFFNNRGSIAEEQEFVCRKVAKLLASGAVTVIQRALVKHWRSKGFRIFTYLDNGAGADQVLNKAMKMSAAVHRDIALSGFIANEEKSQ